MLPCRCFLAFLILIMLVGCAPAAQPLPSTSTQAAAPIPTDTLTPLPTDPPAPTGTPAPSETPSMTATPAPTEDPKMTFTPTPIPPISIVIDRSQVRQTLREVSGGNFIHYFGGVTTPFEPISTMNMETLDPQVVRVRIDLDEWDPDPEAAPEERYQNTNHVTATFEFMRELKARSPQALIVASVWKVPDWMVINPEMPEARVIPPERYPLVVESISTWLLEAKDTYGVQVDYVSFNEANIGVTVSLMPKDWVEVIRVGGPLFKEKGLKTLWLLGDSSNIASFSSYTPRIYAAEDIRPYLGPLSFHSWDAATSDQNIKEIGKFAEENGLDVWCTEAGWDPSQWKFPARFPTFQHAMELSKIYTRVLRDSRASTMLYWEMMGQDYYINDGKNAFPALHYLDLLKDHFPAGSRIVATPDDQIITMVILSLAAETPGDGFSVELLNQIIQPREVEVTGLPDGTYTLEVLSEKDGRYTQPPVQVKDGAVRLTLPGKSMNFLRLQP